jgi:hypothetical protein
MRLHIPYKLTQPPYSYIAIGTLIIVLIGTSVAIAVATRKPSNTVAVATTPTPTSTPSPSPTPTPLGTNWLTRETANTEADLNRRPLAVIVENHPDARPQAGLADADIVYEALAEGGITRFMAVFANPTDSYKVGPIRSARTYFVDYATELGAIFGHVGGNMDALDQIQATSNFYDLDQFSVGSPVYARDTSRKVATEHTMFSTTNGLWEYAITNRRYPATTTTTGAWNIEPITPLEQRPQAQEFLVTFSSASYTAGWTYDRTTNTYARTMGGSAHRDRVSGAQITSSTVILQTVSKQATRTRINEDGLKMTLTGTGSAKIFQNGTLTEATWKKTGNERTRYYNASGTEIGIVPGKTWISLVHNDTGITIK